jgi:RND family efflux transporter MFP subunit
LSQVNRLRLVLPVPESAVPIVRANMPVEVRVESLKRVLQGRVARFTGQLDPSTRTMATEVDVDNRTFEIKPGMFGYATLALESHPNALAVPVQALSGRASPATVLVVGQDKTLQERQVTLGLETPDYVEVLSGVTDGDLVVVGNRGSLKPGLVVRPRITGGATTGEVR